ncbi:MAG: hypothetical protein Q8Q22_02100 [bacterium]|nr:hypothetical protein [bacterium]
MKKVGEGLRPNERLLSNEEFLQSYNQNIPMGYPHASLALLQKFKDEHLSLFKANCLWSLDQHRKRLIDWLPQNI